MFLLETIRLGLANLRLHILRSFLTALGIILGVAAVITMVAIGEGAKQSALAQLEQLGARNLIVRSQPPPEGATQQGGQQRGFITRYGLTRADVEVIRANFPDATAIVPVKEVGAEILRRERRKVSQAFGTTPDLMNLANLRIARGRYLTNADMEDETTVAVIGAEIAKEFFPFDDPIGGELRIDDKSFIVVGVLAPVGLAGGAGAGLVGRDLNLDMHIPMTTARSLFGDLVIRRVSGSTQGRQVEVSELYIGSPARETVINDAERLRRIMEVRRPGLVDIGIIVPYELLESARRAALTWTLVLSFIAGISLLVGGIGIMNIMLATVTERTREIGIRRAIGAKRKHIVWQFLVETGVLSAVGGVIGIFLGVGVSVGVGPLVDWLPTAPGIGRYFNADVTLPTQVTTWSIFLSFGVATATGLIFGIYPAIKAAAQDPIVALRHD